LHRPPARGFITSFNPAILHKEQIKRLALVSHKVPPKMMRNQRFAIDRSGQPCWNRRLQSLFLSHNRSAFHYITVAGSGKTYEVEGKSQGVDEGFLKPWMKTRSFDLTIEVSSRCSTARTRSRKHTSHDFRCDSFRLLESGRPRHGFDTPVTCL